MQIKWIDKQAKEEETWYYEDGLRAYLIDSCKDFECLPAEPFVGDFKENMLLVSLRYCGSLKVAKPFKNRINLIPTVQHGTHVNGLRQGFNRCHA